MAHFLVGVEIYLFVTTLLFALKITQPSSYPMGGGGSMTKMVTYTSIKRPWLTVGYSATFWHDKNNRLCTIHSTYSPF